MLINSISNRVADRSAQRYLRLYYPQIEPLQSYSRCPNIIRTQTIRMDCTIASVHGDEDFEEFVLVEWAAYENPFCRLLRLFFPILGHGAEARAASQRESIERQRSWQKTDSTGKWIKAVDAESGKIVGGALWHHYKENPYAEETEEECTWFPEGQAREMANALMGQFVMPRMKYMTKPHFCK